MSSGFILSDERDIHERHRISAEFKLVQLLALLVSLLLESLAVAFWLHSKFFPGAICYGAGFAVLLAYAALKQEQEKADTRFIWMAVIFTPLMGPVAPGGILISLFWYAFSRQKSLSFREWFESIFPLENKTLAETVYERIIFGRDQSGDNNSIPYLMDVMKMGNNQEKNEAIFKISKHYDASFAPILKQATDDPNNVVRVLAATVMAKVKQSYFAKTLKLEKLKEEEPESTQLLLQMARHCDNYAFSGVLDKEHAAENRDAALRHYAAFINKAHPSSPQMAEAHMAMGRILLRMGRVSDAAAHFEKLRATGQSSTDLNAWYAECLFRLRRFDALRNLAIESTRDTKIVDDSASMDALRGTYLLWAQKPGKVAV